MNRGDMRTLLRSRINEDVEDHFSDAELNVLLNHGLQHVQKQVMKVDPEAFLKLSQADLVAAQSEYPKPEGFWYEIEVSILETASATEYTPLKRGDYPNVRQAASGSTPRYAHYGRSFFIKPAPGASIANGLRCLHVPTLTMAVDTDVPSLHFALHPAIVDWAQVFAFGETSENPDEARKRLRETLEDIPLFYKRSGGEPFAIEPDYVGIAKGY